MHAPTTLTNGAVVFFGRGKFDDWCVFLRSPEGKTVAPRDKEYFRKLKIIGNRFGQQKLYDDFVSVYAPTGKIVDPLILRRIKRLSLKYGELTDEVEQWLTVIYYGMVAEENKEHAVLKKRIKRLGIHQILIEDNSPEQAATFSRGKSANKLDKLMLEKGF